VKEMGFQLIKEKRGLNIRHGEFEIERVMTYVMNNLT